MMNSPNFWFRFGCQVENCCMCSCSFYLLYVNYEIKWKMYLLATLVIELFIIINYLQLVTDLLHNHYFQSYLVLTCVNTRSGNFLKSTFFVTAVACILQVFIIIQNQTRADCIISPTIFCSVFQCMSRTKYTNTALANFPQSGHEYTQCFRSVLLQSVSPADWSFVSSQTGPPEVDSANKDWLHSCRLHQHVHHGDQTGVLTSPSLLSQKHLAPLPSLIVTVFCRLSVTWALTSKTKL